MEVRMKVVVFDVLMSYLNVFFKQKDKTKKEVSIVKIPRIVMIGPKDMVATSVISVPRTPMDTMENSA